MSTRCSTPEVICLRCGDEEFSNSLVYCVNCLNVAVHRCCLDVMPATFDEYVRWVCDDCGVDVQNQPTAVCKQNDVQCKTVDYSTYKHDQVLECSMDGTVGEHHDLNFEDNNIQNLEQETAFAHEHGWSWKREHLQGKNPSVNFYYRKDICESIKNTLKRVGENTLLQRFKEGCFGHLLGWKSNRKNARVVNALVSRQIIIPGAPDYEVWFRINESHIRFSYPEYALVTGLCFGSSNFDPSSNHDCSEVGVFKRFCGGNLQMNIKQLWELFDKNPGPKDANEDDYLKVANVLALYFFALGYDTPRKVESFAWVLVDNLDAWNKFPWGAYTFKAFLHYFNRMKTSALTNKYHFYGPAWTLQIWAFEAIPSLGKVVAKVVEHDSLPRFLKWIFTSSKVSDFHSLLNTVIECQQTLQVTPAEEQLGYWISTHEPNPLGVVYVPPLNPVTSLIGDGAGFVSEAAVAPKPNPKRQLRKKKQLTPPTSPQGSQPPSDDTESDPESPQPSSYCNLCEIREDRIVKKLKAHLLPELMDYMKNQFTPEIMTLMRSLLAQERQPQHFLD